MQRKALALISGGLDSLLAAKVIMEQGIHVEGINFYSGFFGAGTQCVTLKKQLHKENLNSAKWVADTLGIKLHVIDAVQTFKPIMANPPHGYGKNLNPCLDCKIFIVRHALEWMKAYQFDFLVTGEVIGQRPMSQRKDTLPIVAKDSMAQDLLLRPLCAKWLEPTLPEREGWVDREKLHDISGRSRKPQMALAKEFGFEKYPQPAGGCLLTDPGYAARLQDCWDAKGDKDYTLSQIDLLKVGRHIRPAPHYKIIIGREIAENDFLERYKPLMTHLYCTSCKGPLALIDGTPNKDDLAFASRILARFSQGRMEDSVSVCIQPIDQEKIELNISPAMPDELSLDWYT